MEYSINLFHKKKVYDCFTKKKLNFDQFNGKSIKRGILYFKTSFIYLILPNIS